MKELYFVILFGLILSKKNGKYDLLPDYQKDLCDWYIDHFSKLFEAEINN